MPRTEKVYHLPEISRHNPQPFSLRKCLAGSLLNTLLSFSPYFEFAKANIRWRYSNRWLFITLYFLFPESFHLVVIRLRYGGYVSALKNNDELSI